MKCPPLSVQDKTHFCAGGRIPSDFITPRTHTLSEVPSVGDSFVYDARILTSLAASAPFIARDGLTATAASRKRGGCRAPLLLGSQNANENGISENRRPLIGGIIYLTMIFNWEDMTLLVDYIGHSILFAFRFTLS